MRGLSKTTTKIETFGKKKMSMWKWFWTTTPGKIIFWLFISIIGLTIAQYIYSAYRFLAQ